MRRLLGALLPGLFLLTAIALVARLLGRAIPLVTPLILSIGMGAILANTVGLPAWAERGVGQHSLLLETAIVLLGAGLSLEAISTAGPRLVGLVLAVVAFGLVLVTALSRLARLNDRMGTLLAAGSAICGVSAIAAVAPACEARDTQIAHAAATILVFDAVTLVAFPAVGSALGLGPRFYGVWIGLSMFSTGPVAAAGFAHSTAAGEWATMTKLARNALIGLVAVWYSVRYTGRATGSGPNVDRMWTDFPKFLLGFLTLAILANTGVLSASLVDSLLATSDVLFLLAFVGLGFEIRVEEMRNTGLVPSAVVGIYLLAVSALAYALVAVVL
ncbi:MAG: YeiH family protein [Haloarculaceae archaeon]